MICPASEKNSLTILSSTTLKDLINHWASKVPWIASSHKELRRKRLQLVQKLPLLQHGLVPSINYSYLFERVDHPQIVTPVSCPVTQMNLVTEQAWGISLNTALSVESAHIPSDGIYNGDNPSLLMNMRHQIIPPEKW